MFENFHVITFILAVAIIGIVNPMADARSIHDKIPFSTGKQYGYDWIIYLTISLIGVAFNGFSLHLLLTEVESSRMSMYNYLLALYSIGFLFAMVEVIVQSLNVSANTIYGGDTQCQLMSALQITFFFWSISVIMLISYATERKLSAHIKFTNLQIFYYIILGLLYAVFICFGAVYLPTGEYFVLASGMYAINLIISLIFYNTFRYMVLY